MLLSACAMLWLAANPYLPEGRALYGKMRYPEAEARLRVAAEVRSSSTEEQREAYDLLARALVAQGRVEEAETIYAELLSRDPDVPAPVRVSPKISEAFLRAKQRVYPEDFVQLRRRPAAPERLDLELLDPWGRVAMVKLKVRSDAHPESERTLRFERRLASIPLKPAVGEILRCYVEALDASGAVIDQVGSKEQPLLFHGAPRNAAAAFAPSTALAAEAQGPRRWPLYVVGGATAALVAAGTVLAIAASNDHRAIGPGTDALNTRALNDRAEKKALGANFAFAGALAGGAGLALLAWDW